MNERDNPLLTAELTEEQNGNMLDGILNNLPSLPLPQRPEEKELCLLYTSDAADDR